MTRLTDELTRLYGPHETTVPDGTRPTTRALRIIFSRNADWERVAALFRDVQVDLELPPPALSVSASSGYGMWFSLQAAVPEDEAAAFLAALRQRYLAELPDSGIALQPAPGSACLTEVPAEDTASGKWSAFIDPGMGSAFIDEAGLEMAPNPERQADLLAGLASIRPAAFCQALDKLLPAPAPTAAAPDAASPAARHGPFSDPTSFLLAAMNDTTLPMGERIAAAAALLPYFPATAKSPMP